MDQSLQRAQECLEGFSGEDGLLHWTKDRHLKKQ